MRSGSAGALGALGLVVCGALFVGCGGGHERDICGNEQYTNGICDPGCARPDPDCGGGGGGGGGGGDSTASSDPCVRNGQYINGTCDACPFYDPPCELLDPDPCASPNRYGDGTCDACFIYDPDCAIDADADACITAGAYADGTCDACPQYDPDCASLGTDPCEGMTPLYDDGSCDACLYFDRDCGPGAFQLPAVTGVTASDGTESGGIRVQWNRLPPATQYFLRRSTHPVDGFNRVVGKVIDQSDEARPAILDDTVGTGEGFYYQIEAMHPTAYQYVWSNIDFGFVGPVGTGSTAPSAPTGVNTELENPNTPAGSILVFWDFDPDASAYRVLRRVAGVGPFVEVGSAQVIPGWTGPQFVDEDVMPGVLYEYQVIASNGQGDSPAATSAPTGYPGITGPDDLSGTQTAPDEVTLTWSAFPNATGYEVFTAPTGGGAFTESVAQTSSPTLVVDSIPPGTPGTYRELYYRVRAIGAFGRTQLSNLAAVFFYTPHPLAGAPTNLRTTLIGPTYVDLAWDAASGASYYNVEMHDGSGTFEFATTSGSLYVDVAGLTAGTTYTFRVQGVNADNAGGPYSDTLIVTTRLAAPTGVTVTGAQAGIEVSWNAVGGAVSYNLYRYTSCSGGAPLLRNVTGATSFTDTTEPHVKYWYWVAAVDAGAQEGLRTSNCVADYRPLPSPTNVTVTRDNPPLGGVGLRVSYDAVAGASSYGVGQAEVMDGPFVTRIYPYGTSIRMTDDSTGTAMSPVTTYYFRVAARLNAMLGEPSDVVYEMTSVGIPQDVACTTELYDAAEVSWTAVPGASYYAVYRTDENPPGTVSLVATDITDTSYVDTTIPLSEFWSGGATYVSYYEVQAFTDNDVGSGNSVPVFARAKRVFSVAAVGVSDDDPRVPFGPGCPTGPDDDACLPGYVCSGSNCVYPSPPSDGIDVHWSEVEGAATYRIYRKIDIEGAFALMAEVEPGVDVTCDATRATCAWKDTGAATDCGISGGCEQMYYSYRVNAVGPHGAQGPDGGAGSGYVSGSAVLLSPAASATASGPDIRVSWSAVSGAGGYRVMRSANSVAFTEAAIVTGTSYLDTNVTTGVQYRYFVRSLSVEANQETNHIENVTDPVVGP